MLRQATLLQEDTLLLSQDPARPVLAHLNGRMEADTDLIVLKIPPGLGLRPNDDYSIEVSSFRGCFDPTHNHNKDGSVSEEDDSVLLPGPKRSDIFQLDGNDDSGAEEEEEEVGGGKRFKRSPRARGSIIRVALQWNYNRPPSRQLSAVPVEALTPLLLMKTINLRLADLSTREFSGLGFPPASPEIYFLEESSRSVVVLPPGAIFTFSGGGKVVWNMLGFTNLEGEATPFHRGKAGDYVLANFSPFRSRMFVSDVSFSPTKPYFQALPTTTVHETDFWQKTNEMLTESCRVMLGRATQSSVTEFDLSADASLLASNASAPHPPPAFLGSVALEVILAAAIKAFGIADIRTAVLNDPDSVEEVGFKVPLTKYPQLEISKLAPTLPPKTISVTLSVGPEAAAKLGYARDALNISFDAGEGYVSASTSPSYLLSNSASPAEWNSALHGNMALALALTRLTLSVRAKDITQVDQTLERTSRGLLGEFRKAAYQMATRDENVRQALPEVLLDAAAASDTTEADYEYASSDFLLLAPKEVSRFWQSAYALDSANRVVPTVPQEWKTFIPPPPLVPPKPAETTAEQPDEPRGDIQGGESVVESETAAAAAAPAAAATGDEPSTETKTPEAVEEEISEEAGAGAEEVDPLATADVEDVVAAATAATVEEETTATEEEEAVAHPAPTVGKYTGLLAGRTPFSSRSSRRLCPVKKSEGDDPAVTSFPAVFHLTIEEGDKTDWLGPLGFCSYAGTFKGSNGDAIKQHKAILRGGGQRSHITFRAIDEGYDPFVPRLPGLIIAACSFHPHRPRELLAAAAAAAASQGRH